MLFRQIRSNYLARPWLNGITHAESGLPAETRLPLLRANGNFRAVSLEPGAHTIRFRYSPDLPGDPYA